jgi:hypothetical protein
LNAHAPSEDKSDDSKERCYGELEQVVDDIAKYHIKILLGDFNEKLRRENTFKTTIRNESLHQNSNYNDVRIIKFTKSNMLLLRARCSRTDTLASTLGSLLIDHILIDRR